MTQAGYDLVFGLLMFWLSCAILFDDQAVVIE